MYEKDYNIQLQKAGLSEKEALIYQLLLIKGRIKVSDIIEESNLKRGDIYNVLLSLEKKNLAQRVDTFNVAHFEAKDPYNLKDQIDAQRQAVEENNAALNAALPSLLSIFNINQKKPSVRVYEGLQGLSKVYDELNQSGEKELILFRSTNDDDAKGLSGIISDQIKKQIRLGIKTRALTPLEDDSKLTFLQYDKNNLVERHLLSREEFSLPAQYLIWGDTVAIISLRQSVICTVIENKDIAKSLKVIFEYIWRASADFSAKIIAEWEK